MAILTDAHLAPLVRAFEEALKEGAISVVQAEQFCADTYDIVLEQKVRDGERQKALARAALGFADPRNHHAKSREKHRGP